MAAIGIRLMALYCITNCKYVRYSWSEGFIHLQPSILEVK